MSSDDGGIQARGIGSYTINTQETNLLDEQLPEFNQQAGDGPMLLAVRRTKEEDEDSLDRIPQRIAPSVSSKCFVVIMHLLLSCRFLSFMFLLLLLPFLLFQGK